MWNFLSFIPTCAMLLLILSFSASASSAQSLSNRVLVVYNGYVSESREVADHYMARRGIPINNLVRIEPSNDFEISHIEYQSKVETPIEQKLNELGRGNILYIVFSYRTPYRVTGATRTITTTLPAGDNGAGTSIDQYVAKIFDTSNSGTNPYYVASFSKDNSYQPFILLEQHRTQTSALTYSVWRLDAPMVELSKGLVDKAIFAETSGLRGKG